MALSPMDMRSTLWRRLVCRTVREMERRALHRDSLGADEVIDYGATRFETVLKNLDAVIDTVGGDLPERSFQVIRPGGILVTIASMLPEEADKAQNIRAVNAGRASAETLKQVKELIETKQLKLVVGEIFPLAEAHRGRGRIILRMK